MRPATTIFGLGTTAVFVVIFLYTSATSHMTDFAVYRMGGGAILHGRSLYGMVDAHTGLPFTYPPIAAIGFVPAALVPLRVGQVLWTVVLFAALALFISRSLAYAAPDRSGVFATLPTVAWLGPVLLLEPLRHNLDLGQINILLAVGIIYDMGDFRGRIPPGVLTGLAAGMKLTPLIFILFFLLTRRWRAGINGLLAFASTVALGALIAFHDSWTYWTKLAFDPGHVGGVPYTGNQSIYGFLSRVLHGPDHAALPFHLLAPVFVVGGLLLAVLTWKYVARPAGDMICAITGLLVSPISWTHHWLWIFPLFVWLAAGERRPPWGPATTAAGVVLFVIAPIWWVPRTHNVEYHHHGFQIVEANSYVFAAVLFLVGFSVWVARGPLALARPSGDADVTGRPSFAADPVLQRPKWRNALSGR